jgi:hypothetical protein
VNDNQKISREHIAEMNKIHTRQRTCNWQKAVTAVEAGGNQAYGMIVIAGKKYSEETGRHRCLLNTRPMCKRSNKRKLDKMKVKGDKKNRRDRKEACRIGKNRQTT